MPAPLGSEALKAALSKLPAWSKVAEREAITRTYEFADFSQALGFMVRAALVVEKMDHHPEWTNVYKTVTVVLASHDADGVTERDLKLAAAMDRIAAT